MQRPGQASEQAVEQTSREVGFDLSAFERGTVVTLAEKVIVDGQSTALFMADNNQPPHAAWSKLHINQPPQLLLGVESAGPMIFFSYPMCDSFRAFRTLYGISAPLEVLKDSAYFYRVAYINALSSPADIELTKVHEAQHYYFNSFPRLTGRTSLSGSITQNCIRLQPLISDRKISPADRLPFVIELGQWLALSEIYVRLSEVAAGTRPAFVPEAIKHYGPQHVMYEFLENTGLDHATYQRSAISEMYHYYRLLGRIQNWVEQFGPSETLQLVCQLGYLELVRIDEELRPGE